MITESRRSVLMLLNWLVLFTFIVLVTYVDRQAHAQETKPGFAAYAIFHDRWDCDALMSAYKDVPVLRMSVLWNTFGKKMNCLNRWANDSRAKILETHLINEVCHRNGRCDKNEFLHGISVSKFRELLLAKDAGLQKRLQRYSTPMGDWYKARPAVSCDVSVGLESNLDRGAYANLIAMVKPVFPDRCRWVFNPVNNNKFGTAPLPGTVHELHGNEKKLSAPCRVNLDGVDVALKARPAIVKPKINGSDLPPFFKSYTSCDSADIWVAESNGLEGGSFIYPLRRTKFLSKKVAQELNTYMKPKAVVTVPPWDSKDDLARKGCKTYLKTNDGYKVGFLWKQSEPEVLGRGAVVFLPTQFNNLKLDKSKVFVLKRDQKIATAYEASRYTEDGKNRQFWRFRKKAPEFPFNVVVHLGNICAVITNPKERVD